MGTDSYYLLATLPPLDPPGSKPPLSLSELVERVSAGRPGRLVATVVLADDLLQRQAAMAGELENPDPAVLTRDQALGRDALPSELEAPPIRAEASIIPADAMWRGYYFHAMSVASQVGSGFLREWVGYEVALRNALAMARAKALELDRSRFRVARPLERPGAEVDAAVDLWAAAEDPLSASRALIAAQWRWVEHAEPRYTFHDDEFAAYAAKLVLLHRGYRMEIGPGAGPVRETVEAE